MARVGPEFLRPPRPLVCTDTDSWYIVLLPNECSGWQYTWCQESQLVTHCLIRSTRVRVYISILELKHVIWRSSGGVAVPNVQILDRIDPRINTLSR